MHNGFSPQRIDQEMALIIWNFRTIETMPTTSVDPLRRIERVANDQPCSRTISASLSRVFVDI